MMDKLSECFFLIENDECLEKYNSVWDKVSAAIKKEFDSKPFNNKPKQDLMKLI